MSDELMQVVMTLIFGNQLHRMRKLWRWWNDTRRMGCTDRARASIAVYAIPNFRSKVRRLPARLRYPNPPK
jgi:hypothetical protein